MMEIVLISSADDEIGIDRIMEIYFDPGSEVDLVEISCVSGSNISIHWRELQLPSFVLVIFIPIFTMTYP